MGEKTLCGGSSVGCRILSTYVSSVLPLAGAWFVYSKVNEKGVSGSKFPTNKAEFVSLLGMSCSHFVPWVESATAPAIVLK